MILFLLGGIILMALFWFHPKGLIRVEIVVHSYKLMITPLSSQFPTLSIQKPSIIHNLTQHIDMEFHVVQE